VLRHFGLSNNDPASRYKNRCQRDTSQDYTPPPHRASLLSTNLTLLGILAIRFPAACSAPQTNTPVPLLSGPSPPATRCRRSSCFSLSNRSSASAVSPCSWDHPSARTQSTSPTSALPAVAPPPAPPRSPRTSPEPAPRYRRQMAGRSYAAPNSPETAPSSRSGRPTYAPGSAGPLPSGPLQSPAPATPETPRPQPPQHAPHRAPDISRDTAELSPPAYTIPHIAPHSSSAPPVPAPTSTLPSVPRPRSLSHHAYSPESSAHSLRSQAPPDRTDRAAARRGPSPEAKPN